jgi:hypothetical protein
VKPQKNQLRNPHNLPVKVCEACGRPYTWRRKWALNWDEVRYCSDACRAAPKKAKGQHDG